MKNVNVDGISRQSPTDSDTDSQIIPTVRLTTTAGAQEAPTWCFNINGYSQTV